MKLITASFVPSILVSMTIFLSQTVLAQTVEVSNAWVRATVRGQTSTGIFMNLKSPVALTLIGVTTPTAPSAEIHQMRMEGDLMRMQALTELALPAGKLIELKPGGYHIMLLDLRTPLSVGTAIPVTLRFQNAQHQIVQQTLQVPVKK